jgi:hypothetical protein
VLPLSNWKTGTFALPRYIGTKRTASEKGKVYRVIQDDDAVREGYIRIVDESSEDHLYPASYFVALDLPRKAQDALFASLDGENRPTNAST